MWPLPLFVLTVARTLNNTTEGQFYKSWKTLTWTIAACGVNESVPRMFIHCCPCVPQLCPRVPQLPRWPLPLTKTSLWPSTLCGSIRISTSEPWVKELAVFLGVVWKSPTCAAYRALVPQWSGLMTTSASQLCSSSTAVDYQLCVGPGYCGLADLRPLPHSFIPTVFSIHSTA